MVGDTGVAPVFVCTTALFVAILKYPWMLTRACEAALKLIVTARTSVAFGRTITDDFVFPGPPSAVAAGEGQVWLWSSVIEVMVRPLS